MVRRVTARPPAHLFLRDEVWEDVLLDPDPKERFTVLDHRPEQFIGVPATRTPSLQGRVVALRWPDGDDTFVTLP